MVNNEISLLKAIIDQAITDSLREPLDEASLPKLPPGMSSSETRYQTIQQKRKTDRNHEYHRTTSQYDLAGEYIKGLYAVCYKEDIAGLLEELRKAWADIEDHPDKSAYYTKIFKAKRGKR